LKGGITARAIEVVLVNVLHVPITVMFALATAAVLLAVSVSVDEVLVLVGLNDAVTPLGNPESDKFTVPLKPSCGVIVIVLVPVEPRVIVMLLADADSE